jgi:hypothetical protein
MRWRGTLASLWALLEPLKVAGWKFDLDPESESEYYTLTATYAVESAGDKTPSNDPAKVLADIWTLTGNDLEKSLWEHPKIKTELNKIATETSSDADWKQLLDFRKAINDYVSGSYDTSDPDYATIGDLTPALSPPINSTIIKEFIGLMCMGTDTYTVSQYVLRRTVEVPWNTSFKPSLTNVGNVYSTSSLTSIELIPSSIKFTLPDGYWLKRTPTMEQQASGTWQVTQEWWHADSYSTFIYEQAS